MRQPCVADEIADALQSLGIDCLFGLFGDGNLSFMGSMALRPGVTVVHARHEESAVFMAAGWSRATGRASLASVTAGPAVAHTLTPLTSAVRAGLPVIVYAGDTPPGPASVGNPQTFDHRAFADLAGALFHRVDGSQPVHDGVVRAVAAAIERSRPLVLSVAEDFADSVRRRTGVEIAGPAAAQPALPVHTGRRKVPADASRAAAERVAEALSTATSPMLVAGSGAVAAGIIPDIVALAETTGAMLATTFRAKGCFDGAPGDVGIMGLLTHRVQQRLQERADLLVGFGASMHGFGASADTLFEAPILCVGAERYGRLTDPHPSNCELGGDVGEVVAEVRRIMAGRAAPSGALPATWSKAKAFADDFDELPEWNGAGELDPRRAMIELDELLPDDALVVIGGGHFWSWPMLYLSKKRREFIFPLEFGSIGMAVPTGIGVAAAVTDRPVVVIEGDGGVILSIHDLETAARHDLPMTVIIVDDAALGAEYHKLRARGLRAKDSAYPPVRFGEIATQFGARGFTAGSVAALREPFEPSDGGSRTTVVDVRVTRAVTSRWYRRMHRPAP